MIQKQTRFVATIEHHGIARARIEPVGNTLAAAKRNATKEFGGELLDATIHILDTRAPIYGDDPAPGNQAVVAWRKVSADRWSAA